MGYLRHKKEFTEGEQPCKNFTPTIDMNEYGAWENEHSCVRCDNDDVTVSFCENCHKDHHRNGWDTCKASNEEKDNEGTTKF